MSSIRGAIAESIFCTWALENGMQVSAAIRGQQLPYDFVVDRFNSLFKVQVKRAHPRGFNRQGQWRVSLKKTNGKAYNDDEVDLFAVICVEHKTLWLIPKCSIGDKSEITVTAPAYQRFKFTWG